MPDFNELTAKSREVLAELLEDEDGDNDLRAKVALGLLKLDQRPQGDVVVDGEVPPLEEEAKGRFTGQFK